MKDSKLAEILRTFSPSEFKAFDKFIASPYFTFGRDLTPFLKILKTFYPEFTHKNFTHEYIYSKLFKGKDSAGKVQQTVKTLSSDLINACKEFFKQTGFENDARHSNYYLLDQLRTRKLYKDFEKEYKKSAEEHQQIHKGGMIDFIENYYLSSVYRDYSLDRDDFINSFEYTLSADENVVAAALMMCFMFEDEKNIAEGYNLPLRLTLMGSVLDNVDEDTLLKSINPNESHYQYLLVFYHIYKMNKYQNERKHFYELKELLIKSKDLFGQSENYAFWNMLLSYCSVNMLEAKEFLSIFDHILKNNIYKKSGKEDIHIMLFRNIVIKAFMYGSVEWLENFIENHLHELHEKHRENMANFSYAHLNFAKRDFEKALMYISRINYDIFIFKMDVRILLLEIYYELNYLEQAYSMVDSTIHFIKSTNEFAEKHKFTYLNFMRNYKEILRHSSSGKASSHDYSYLKQNILNDEKGIQIKWMVEKIEHLERTK